MDKNVINIQITAQDVASQTLQKVSGDVEKVGKNSGKAAKDVGKLDRSTKDLGDSSKKTGSAMESLGSVIKVLAAQQVISRFGEMAEQAARFEDVAAGFERSFGNADIALNKLRRSSNGAISDFNLMLAANRASLLGVTTNVEDLAGLMQTATLRGREMGLTTTQAFDDIVTGIGRGSPLILDNLGIVIPDAVKKMTEGMTDAESKATLLNFAIKDGEAIAAQYGSTTTTASEKIAAMQASFDNLAIAIGKGVLPILEFVATKAAELVETIFKMRDAVDQLTGTGAAAQEKLERDLSVRQANLRALKEGKISSDEFRQRAANLGSLVTTPQKTATMEGISGTIKGNGSTFNINVSSSADPNDIAAVLQRSIKLQGL